MKLKSFIKYKYIAVFVATFFMAFGLFGANVSAATPDELCKDKIRVDACKDALKASCDKKRGDEKNKCYEDRANDFKSPAGASPSGSTKAKAAGRCGNEKTKDSVETKFNFSCLGNDGPDDMTAIEDVAYAIIRFLSYGVGLAVVLAIVLAGIQYSASEGNPEATQKAKSKIQNAIIALFIYLFSFSLLQFLVPGGVFAGSIVDPSYLILIKDSSGA